MRNQDELAGTRAAGCLLIGIRLVFRHDVLAFALRENPGDDRPIEHLQRENGRCDARHDECGDCEHRKEEREHRDDDDHAREDRAAQIGVRGDREVLDGRSESRFLLKLLGYVKRGLLFFFGSRRARAKVWVVYSPKQTCPPGKVNPSLSIFFCIRIFPSRQSNAPAR